MQSLAVKYRPTSFEEVCSQKSIISILEKQIQKEEFPNCYLFVGPSGVGKTTIARILANGINKGQGQPIEIDGASNNGVENVRSIIEEAQTRSLDSKYKIYIIDECHMITTAGWNAFLKCIEEPPKYTIFIFCTTEIQKVPSTIVNRVMKFNLSKIDASLIKERLTYICENEGITNYVESIDYISKIANGGMRDAISYLEKCYNFSSQLDLNTTTKLINDFNYNTLLDLTAALLNKDEQYIIKIVDKLDNEGNDLKLFLNNFIGFTLDLSKYCIFQDINYTNIPNTLLEDVIDITNEGCKEANLYFNKLTDKLLETRSDSRFNINIKENLVIKLLQFVRA